MEGNKDELISREDTLDVFAVGRELLRRALDNADVVGVEREKYEWGLGLIESYIDDVKDLPAAQPQKIKGKWIDEGVYGDGYGAHAFRCSVCGWYILDYNVDPFCRWCGADMREGE